MVATYIYEAINYLSSYWLNVYVIAFMLLLLVAATVTQVCTSKAYTLNYKIFIWLLCMNMIQPTSVNLLGTCPGQSQGQLRYCVSVLSCICV